MRRWIHNLAFSLVTAVIGVVILVSPFGIPIEREFGLNWLFSIRGPVAPPPKVAVVGINSQTGSDMAMSRLPRNWPRSLHAVLTERADGTYLVSVRAPLDNKQGADELCRKFPTGGGRAAAAGINALPREQLQAFIDAFVVTYA